jgi:hypothetical protein
LDILIAKKYFPKKIYAIDVDYKMIKKAKRTLFMKRDRDNSYNELLEE